MLALLLLIAWLIPVSPAAGQEKGDGEKNLEAKLTVNSLCCVCHLDLQTEEIAAIHLNEGVSCADCHGSSTGHMQDEMLMTKPDLLYGREEVDSMCRECHEEGLHADPRAVEDFRTKWLGRNRPNGRVISAESICTDCHGTHNIVTRMGSGAESEQPFGWFAAFNGKDLAGWRPSGDASWTVDRGRIVAASSPGGSGGGLWTDAVFEDYLLSLTFRADWPISAGVWLRGEGARGEPRIEICEKTDPPAHTGSVRISGEGLALANLRDDLVARETWNTLSAKVQGDRIEVWLNGEELGSVKAGGTAAGRIGLFLEPCTENADARLIVRELVLQRLSRPSQIDPDFEAKSHPIFNGRDLAGWEVSGGAIWTVEDGCLVGIQGKNNAPGDLLTVEEYGDFLLRVTYRNEWPCNSGIWFRYQAADRAYQADILEYMAPECYSGTLYCTGKMFLAMNKDKSIVDRDGWNTIQVRAEGGRIQTWINGIQIADVLDDTSGSGRIGFQIHAGNQFGPMKMIVRDASIMRLGD